ncbi:hypothetical protein MMC20_003425 [Loxospora ochrophaea]|nr:hypothetical protein [Loxospora ochrophaea]
MSAPDEDPAVTVAVEAVAADAEVGVLTVLVVTEREAELPGGVEAVEATERVSRAGELENFRRNDMQRLEKEEREFITNL